VMEIGFFATEKNLKYVPAMYLRQLYLGYNDKKQEANGPVTERSARQLL
jgi:hypothetical protein